MKCKICNTDAVYFDKAKILNKYDVSYYKCPQCGSVFTESPYWLEEAYDNAITDTDIGLVGRNIDLGRFVTMILLLDFPDASTFLDYGGGYGLFTRIMRDNGFDFEWYDKYCDNLFARGHEKMREHYDVITAFELFEHLPDPLDTISELVNIGDTLLFTTDLIDDSVHSVGSWWYFSTETGQHVMFYSSDGMKEIARKLNVNYYKTGGVHILTKHKLNPIKLRLSGNKVLPLVNRFLKRQSLLQKDYEAAKQKLLEN